MSYADEVLADAPVGLWLLDETSGTVATDSSGNGNHGTYVGSPALATATIHGLVCPDFDAIDDHVTLPAIDVGTGPYTLEAIARADTIVNRAVIFGEVYVPDTTVVAMIGLNLDGAGSSDRLVGLTYSVAPFGAWHPIYDGTWTAGDTHHVVYTYDGTDARFYVDGALIGTLAHAAVASNDGWRIGVNTAPFGRWNGPVAGVGLYDTALDATRVADHYDALFAPLEAAVALDVSFSLSATAEPDPQFAAAALTINLSLSATAAGTAEPDPVTAAAALTVTFSLDVIVRPVGIRRRLVVVDIWGTPYGELTDATVGAITYALNEPEQFSLMLPLSAPSAHLVLAQQFREIQVWRGDTLLAWGPMVRPAADKHTLAVSCHGAAWYLTRRHVGRASRANHLVNGDFEDGTTGWRVGALDPFEPLATRDGAYWSATTPTGRALTGTHALRLEQYASGAPRFGVSAVQAFVWTVDTVEGDEWSAVGRFFIPSDSWRGPPADGIGIQLDRYSTVATVTTQPDGGGPVETLPAPIETVTATIDESTPRDVWLPLEVRLRSPVTGEAEFVSVRLGCPDGVIYWDRVALALDEGLRFYDTDQAEIAAGLIAHLQDADYGKSPLNLATDMPATGVHRDRTYQFHEHANGADAVAELTQLADGLDWSVAYTATTRTVRSHHPARGVHRPGYAIELGRSAADFAWTLDGENAANEVVVLGTGDGSAREETSATAPSAYAGGLTLETVYSAPPGTPIDSLEGVATEQLAVTTMPDLLSVTLTSPAPGHPGMIGILACGDTVPVRLRAGALLVEATYRIVALTITPTDTLELTLNRRDDP